MSDPDPHRPVAPSGAGRAAPGANTAADRTTHGALDARLDAQLQDLAGTPPQLSPRAARVLVRAAATPARTQRRKRWAVSAGVVLAAGALILPTAAIAERLFAAQTGEFAEPGQSEVSAGEEWIDPNTSDFASFVASVAPTELPAPDGFDWDEAARLIAARYASTEPTRLADGLLGGDYERELWLAWIVEWIEADRDDDAPRRSAALDALRAAPAWPHIAAADGGGIRYVMWAFVARVQDPAAEDRAAAAQALLQFELSSCEAEASAGRGCEVWDRVDRQALIDGVFAEYTATLGPEPVMIDDAYWAQYDVDLRAIAARAGVADPEAAVGTRRSAAAQAGSGEGVA
ncbi:hypothetical protein [Leucobacter chromiireducens]|uniref:hypothetical protein n=1 Tax=Leucobacter chromiireducens TaxID=283877 RepID=UPI00192636A1|nr:hypothetical protein [Leucobacter chromiireducens]